MTMLLAPYSHRLACRMNPQVSGGTIFVPGVGGGANWPGAGFDPETNVLFVPSQNVPYMPFMAELPDDESNLRYIRLQNRGIVGPRRLPLLKPPYATITAFDMNRGEDFVASS